MHNSVEQWVEILQKSIRPFPRQARIRADDVKAIKERLSILLEDGVRHGVPTLGLINSAKLQLQRARERWAKKVESMAMPRNSKPSGEYADAINKSLALRKVYEGEARDLNQVLSTEAERLEKIKMQEKNQKQEIPLLFRNSGKMKNGKLYIWDGRLVERNKEGDYVFQDDPEGENLEDYKIRINQLKNEEIQKREKEGFEARKKMLIGV